MEAPNCVLKLMAAVNQRIVIYATQFQSCQAEFLEEFWRAKGKLNGECNESLGEYYPL